MANREHQRPGIRGGLFRACVTSLIHVESMVAPATEVPVCRLSPSRSRQSCSGVGSAAGRLP
jgi:hypothetical protein